MCNLSVTHPQIFNFRGKQTFFFLELLWDRRRLRKNSLSAGVPAGTSFYSIRDALPEFYKTLINRCTTFEVVPVLKDEFGSLKWTAIVVKSHGKRDLN